jgi:hypothetical protein
MVFATASLLVAGIASPAAAAPDRVQAAAHTTTSSDPSCSHSYSFPWGTDYVVGDVATVSVSSNCSDPSTVHLQQQVSGATDWTDLAVHTFEPGPGKEIDFPVPTDQPGTYDLRLVFDATANFTAITTPAATFHVDPAPPPPPPPVVKDPSTITMSAPSAAPVRVGTKVSVTGAVTGGTSRTVRLELGTRKG